MFTIQNKNRTISVVIILAMVLSLAPVNPARAATLTQSVTTIAGNGLATFSGDGGPATAAALNSPPGVAVAADGTVYVADSGNLRIRRISPGGVISTIAGNGTYGDSGDGGQATAAQLGSVGAIALSPADDILYISDNGMNRVRQVLFGSGVISTFAGRGLDYIGHDGNGGPATDASIGIPFGIAVDPAGNVYFTEFMYCTVRKVDIATHVITRVAGSGLVGDCASDGDGGDALAARLSSPNNVATDAAGNLFLIETETDTVRRIDAGTHIITTVAGGGVTTPGFGAATTMDLGEIEGLAIDDADNLYVSNFSQVFKVDPGTGILSVFAGTGTSGFSGDGGSAQDATFSNIWGLDVRGDALFIADSNNNRIRAVVPPPLPDDLIIELATSQALLDSLTAVPGSILMINVDGREYLLIPNATSVGLDVTLTGNDQLIIVDLGALQSVGGSITISGNLAMQSIDLSSLATVDGSLTISGNPALNAILISGVTSIDGDLTVVGTAATVIDVSSLTTVTGSLDISDNDSATAINMAGLTTVGGSLDLSGNTSVSSIDLGGVTTIGGNLDVSGNTSATVIDMASLTTVGGSLTFSDNPAADPINMAGLTTVGGSLDLSGNTSVSTIDMGGLTTVSGDLTVVDNGDAAVDMSAGTDVGGDLTVETTGTGSFSMGDGTVTGDATVDTTGYTDMSGNTPGGVLDLTATRAEAVMHLQIQAATFATPVGFTVTRVDPVALAPESGLDDGGGPATIDPVAAYQFDFAVPTLDRDASLSFDIVLAQLAAATQTAVLDALAAGNVTMVTKGDAAGSVFQAFPICSGADVPTVDGCVLVETFDALGQPTSGTPAIVRFSNVVGHFSTWAVAIVTPMPQADLSVTKTDNVDPVTDGDQIIYTVMVTNNGPDAAENVNLRDTLPSGVGFQTASISQGTCAVSAPLIQCQLGTMEPGDIITLTVRVIAHTPGVITNSTSVSSDTDDPNMGNNNAREETTITALQADLSVTKTDNVDPVTDGDQIIYTVMVTNNGPDAAENVNLRDTLPSGVGFQTASISQGTCAVSAPLIQCQLGTMEPGDIITLTVRVIAHTPGVITNSTSVSSDTDDPNMGNNNAREETTITALQADLSVTKTDDVDPVAEGDQVIYRVVVTNNGPDAAENVVLTDTFPPYDLYYLGSAVTQGSCSLGSAIQCELGTVESGATVTLTVRFTARTRGVIYNSAAVSSDTDDPDTSNNRDSEDTTVGDTTPPDTAIDGGPANPTNSSSASFTFHGSDDMTLATSLTFECALDGGSFSACASPTVFTGLADGNHLFAVRARDGAGNLDPTPAAYSSVVDTTPPTLNPVVSPNPVILNGSASVTSGAADALSGLALQSCDALDTSSVGTKSATCYAMDNAGNTNSASVSYSVVYIFTGFSSPVDNLPTLNLVIAGRAIPVKFSLGGDQGLNIFAAGYPKSEQITCSSTAPVDGVETTLTAGSSSLSYDPSSDQYIYVWKTDKSWAGMCRQLVLKLIDGTFHRANFKFK